MRSINAELEVIKMLEEELTHWNKDEFKHQLESLKSLAHTIEQMINTKESDCDIDKATNILCKHIGIMWQNVFIESSFVTPKNYI